MWVDGRESSPGCPVATHIRGSACGARTRTRWGGGGFGLVMGLGFVLSFGYWCTDFLVIQRAMAADSMDAARRTPLIAAIPKMFFPFLVILPGLIALAITGPSRIRRRPPVTAHIPQPSNMRTAPRGGFLWSLVEGLGLTPLVLTPLVPGRLPAAKSIRAPWSL